MLYDLLSLLRPFDWSTQRSLETLSLNTVVLTANRQKLVNIIGQTYRCRCKWGTQSSSQVYARTSLWKWLSNIYTHDDFTLVTTICEPRNSHYITYLWHHDWSKILHFINCSQGEAFTGNTKLISFSEDWRKEFFFFFLFTSNYHKHCWCLYIATIILVC